MLFQPTWPSLSWPSTCAVCRSWPAKPVCAACAARFASAHLRCPLCAMAWPARADALPAQTPLACGDCLVHPPPLQACFAAVDYAYPWSDLIARFKFREQPGLARHLSDLMRETPGVPEAIARADLVLPMPLATARLRSRGYNQALLLSRHLAASKTDARLLLRIQDTPAQNQQGRSARLANMRHAFAVEPARAGLLAGRRVVLVDDVMTTGASLYNAARVLQHAGASGVSAVVLARTPQAMH